MNFLNHFLNFLREIQNNKMTTDSTLSEVCSTITGAKFTLVRQEIQENINNFLDWAENLLMRANSNKKINLAIDCEGYCLGSVEKSLSCIQIGEIFNDSFDIKVNKNPPEIGSLPGYIVFTPFDDAVKTKLTEVLNHPSVTIFTFDFIGDFATIIESGIPLEMNNIYDSQLSTKDKPDSYIRCKSAGLAGIVKKAKKMDPLGLKAEQMKNRDKKNYFKVSTFLLKDNPNPASQVLTKDLLEMGADDIYMTGLAAVFSIKKGFTEAVITKTKEKVEEFKKFVDSMQSVLAPPIQRHLFFMRDLTFDQDVPLNDETEENLITLLEVFQKVFYIINGYKILKENFECQVSLERANEVYEQVVHKLDDNRSRLNEMLEKYA